MTSTPLKVLSEALGDDSDAIWLLGRLGVRVIDGCYDRDAFREALLRSVENPPQSEQLSLIDSESARRSLFERLGAYGIEVLGQAFGGARLTLKLPNGKELRALAYISTSIHEASGQVGFQVRHVNDEEISWVFFVSSRLNLIFMRRRVEILQAHHPRKGEKGQPLSIPVAFSAASKSSLLENRIKEMLKDSASGWAP
jgi:hypothetical protein